MLKNVQVKKSADNNRPLEQATLLTGRITPPRAVSTTFKSNAFSAKIESLTAKNNSEYTHNTGQDISKGSDPSLVIVQF